MFVRRGGARPLPRASIKKREGARPSPTEIHPPCHYDSRSFRSIAQKIQARSGDTKYPSEKKALLAKCFFLWLIRLKLLNFNSCACCLESCLNCLSVILGYAFLNSLGSALNEVLSVLKSETGDLTNCLDNVELLSAEVLEDYVELGLLLSCGSCCACYCCACSCYGSCRYTELLLDCLYEVVELENSECLYLVNDCCDLFACHFCVPPKFWL